MCRLCAGTISLLGTVTSLSVFVTIKVADLLPRRLVLNCRPLVALQHVDRVKELLALSVSFLVQNFIARLLLHVLHRALVLTRSPPVAFGPSTAHGPPVAGSVIPVADVGVGTSVFVLDHHQICWHLLELIDQPLPLHFGQDASLIVIPGC